MRMMALTPWLKCMCLLLVKVLNKPVVHCLADGNDIVWIQSMPKGCMDDLSACLSRCTADVRPTRHVHVLEM